MGHAKRRILLTLALLGAGLGGCAFDDPSVVVSEAVDAARRGDRDDFMACFTPRSGPILEVWWRATEAAQPELALLGAGDVRVVAQRPFTDRDFGPERALLSLREGERQMSIVVHRMGGAWRIDLHDTERVGQGGLGP
ncbi:MAG: hypothetical protein IT385_16440 [Deltaproteobacteria bacterium]|nr:hypothetical protein [Deltaproteobacteria bacterium]